MKRPHYRKLLLLGAGHGHLDLLKKLHRLTARGVEVTVVSPEPVGLYSGMLPGLLGATYGTEEVSLPVREIVEARGGTFIQDTAVEIRSASREVRLGSGQWLSFDALSVATGSVVATEQLPRFEGGPEDDVFPVKPYANVEAAQKRVRELLHDGDVRSVVVGGGPAAVELAGNLARLARRARGDGASGTLEIALVCGGAPLAQFPEGCRRKALGDLAKNGVHLCRGPRAHAVRPGTVVLEDGFEEQADVVILAPGVKPPSLLAASDLPTAPDGGIVVDETMRAHTEVPVFAAGDSSHLASNPLARIGAHALRGGKALSTNLIQLVRDGEISRRARYSPTRSVFLALNLGDSRAAACFRGTSLFGRWVFTVKDLIDTSFVGNTKRSARGRRLAVPRIGSKSRRSARATRESVVAE